MDSLCRADGFVVQGGVQGGWICVMDNQELRYYNRYIVDMFRQFQLEVWKMKIEDKL